MPKRSYHFVDSKFNEFVYDALVNITPQQRDRLSPVLAAKIRTRTALKRFVNGGTLEQKIVMLTTIGIETSLLVYKPESFDVEAVKRVYKQNSMNGTPAENIAEMMQNQFFLLHSKDIAQALVMMSMNCHGDSFYINKDFLKVRKAINTTKHLELSDLNVSRQTAESLIAFKEVCRIMVLVMGMDSYLEGKTGLYPVDVMVMLLLAMHPNNYVSLSYLRRVLAHKYQEAVIARSIMRLFNQFQYIDRLPKQEDVRSYRITQLGLLEVGKLVNYTVNTPIT